LAEASNGAAQRGLPIVRPVLGVLQHLAGQQQGKGRGVDERRVRSAELLRPVRPGELVGDEFIGGVRVGDPKQRFGEAHHRDALVRSEVVGVEEGVDARRLVGANPLHQGSGGRRPFAEDIGRETRLRDALGDYLLLVRPVGAPQLGPAGGSGDPPRPQASCPWQCLYFLPEPHGHGALRLIGASATPPSPSLCGIAGCGMFMSGGRPAISPRVPASMSAVSSSAENGSRCWVMKSGSSGGGAASSRNWARIRTRVTSSRIETSSRSNSRKASCLYSSIGF